MQVISFLGLGPIDKTVWQAMDQVTPNSWAKGKMMLPEARQKLIEFYRPFNNQLHNLVRGGEHNFLDWNE